MYKILLFYKYIDLENPHAIADWHKELCERLSLKGRIIIAHEGINATVGGLPEDIDHYKKQVDSHALFVGIDFKEAYSVDAPFPRLRVVVKNEIVHLGLDPKVINARDAGTYLTPEEAHKLVSNKPDNLVIIDCRNKVETDIGTFEGSIRPNTNHFREFPEFVDANQDLLKDKQVLMYCTGGVRCERASAYIKSKNVAQEVFHIQGGIERYVEQFPNGHFKGKNYVFDGRLTVRITNDILAECSLCSKPWDDYENCIRAACNKHYIGCPKCVAHYQNACSQQCHDLVYLHNAPKRPMRKKTEHISLTSVQSVHRSNSELP
ncbi:hypothetical protein Noda2021_10110 [Candidatus Dependentiae bacterium Noda2021]|nr:hypothetical protein Noda2021_10110 [Candidatus Dependentiae bacterium Noda2021]